MKKILPDYLNKRSKLTDEQKEEIKNLHQQGKTIAQIARYFNVSDTTVRYHLFGRKKKQDWKKYYDKEDNTKRRRDYRARLKAAKDNYKEKLSTVQEKEEIKSDKI